MVLLGTTSNSPKSILESKKNRSRERKETRNGCGLSPRAFKRSFGIWTPNWNRKTKKNKEESNTFFFLPAANRIDVWQPNLLLVAHLLSFVFVVTWIPPSPHTLDSPTSSSSPSSSLKNLVIFSSAPHVPKPAPRTCPFLFISNITTIAPLHSTHTHGRLYAWYFTIPNQICPLL